MAYIKKLVMNGFKSFARRTEIPFDKGINVILGPNGSGKSNIADALCFVLGRLSIKSMRAAKAANLLFMGSPIVKPAREASVELIFDNSDRAFNMECDEIKIERIVRRGGQGIYKINGETKTRAEIIEMLAHAGIDPYGYNIVLQGQIDSIVKMHPEDRRKIIEEIAGISIYEARKEKSLHELEKSEEKLKEVSAILRERTAYLKNLDRERAQALKFKELEETARRCKASIIHKRREEKIREINSIVRSIEEKTNHKDKVKGKAEAIQKEIDNLAEEINEINKSIQKASGIEQETLNNTIANFRAEIEGLKVRKENYENRAREIEKRISELTKSIPEMEAEIDELKKESPLMAKKAQELKKKKDELGMIEEERKKALTWRSELNSLKERIKDKEKQIARVNAQSEALLKAMEESSVSLEHKSEEECAKAINLMQKQLSKKRDEIDESGKNELESEKEISVYNNETIRAEKIKADVEQIDVCPLCQSKITEEHIRHVMEDCERKISDAKNIISKAESELNKIRKNKNVIEKGIKEIEMKITDGERELSVHKALAEKNEQLKRFVEEENALKNELAGLENKMKGFEGKNLDLGDIELRYNSKILEIEEISSRTEEDVDTTILYKSRELEKVRNIVQQSKSDLKEVEESVGELSERLELKTDELKEKEGQAEELNKRFKKMFESRDEKQKEIQEKNLSLSELQEEIRETEDQVNYFRIGKAKLDAEKEAHDMEMTEFAGIELLQGSLSHLEERLAKTQESLKLIGGINMRALEVYDEVKKEYDAVQEKVNTLEKEKEDILKIIEEIDKKKTRAFMKTFRGVSDLFSENFAKLSSKGMAFLEIENQEDIFSGGIDILVKLGKGKYFDITSLSGGEKTLVALSLLFAIQEHKPYHFYILDEIDAALDKRNSERLAALLNRYMKSGQYIVITHNDAIILNSDILYGVSMHDGVSKILSLKVGDQMTRMLGPVMSEKGAESELEGENVVGGPDEVVKKEMEQYVHKMPSEDKLDEISE